MRERERNDQGFMQGGKKTELSIERGFVRVVVKDRAGVGEIEGSF